MIKKLKMMKRMEGRAVPMKQKKVANLLTESNKRKLWTGLRMSIAMVVVLFTTSNLVLPAITLSSDDVCGYEEHVHTDACYQLELSCNLDEAVVDTENAPVAAASHEHIDSCYETVNTLTCTQEDHTAETHTEDCYTNESNLICDLDTGEPVVDPEEPGEAQGHTHNEECYQQVLICEIPTHTHGDECYGETEILDEEIPKTAGIPSSFPDSLPEGYA